MRFLSIPEFSKSPKTFSRQTLANPPVFFYILPPNAAPEPQNTPS